MRVDEISIINLIMYKMRKAGNLVNRDDTLRVVVCP